MAAVGGLVAISARSDTAPDRTTNRTTEPPSTSSAPAATDPPSVTIGSVAPPVTVASDVLGDVEFETVLDDFQPVEPPTPPAQYSVIPPGTASNDRVKSDLPDGYYLGYPDFALEEDSRFISWHIGSPDGPAYPAMLDSILFASLTVDARRPDHPGNAAVKPDTLWQLIAGGQDTQVVPDTDDVVIIRGPYLLTVVAGAVVGIEGIKLP